jgi:ppGpp synthetase/RelA/SpoT-type nucleotidyltranferase
MSVVDNFLARYVREVDFYQEAARLCSERCETELEQNGVRAIVSHRAKRLDRLREKVESRKDEKGYRRVEDIYEDIVDLAGVRIALYFPSDIDEVERIIKSRFVVENTKEFPRHSRSRNYGEYETRFLGYAARYYHVRLSPNDLAEDQQRYAQAHIEIQLASVLVHAWSEVEHDLAYKRVDQHGYRVGWGTVSRAPSTFAGPRRQAGFPPTRRPGTYVKVSRLPAR